MATRSKSQNYNFTWKLSPKQRQVFESNARFRVGMMGRRFGKNEVGTAAIVDYATQPDKYDFGSDSEPLVWHVAPTYRQAYRYGYQKVLEKLPAALIDSKKGSERTPSKIELVTGAELEFLSYNNPEGLQGEGVDLISGDEWAYSSESVWENDLRPMLLDSGGGAILVSKPLGENHFYEFYERGQSPEFPEWDSWHATAYENPWIPDSEIDKAKKTTPESVFRQEYLADPQAGGTLLTLDMLEYESWEVLDADWSWKWHVAVDIGVTMDERKARDNDTDFWAAAIVSEHPFKGYAYLVQVLRERGQTPAQAAEWINGICSTIPTNKVYYEAVQAQKWLQEELANVGLQPVAVEQNRAKEERITFLSVPFDNGNVKLIDWNGEYDESHEPHPENRFDWSDYRNEWAGFPNAAHDDQLDATEMALRHVNFGGDFPMTSADPYEQDEPEDDGWRPYYG